MVFVLYLLSIFIAAAIVIVRMRRRGDQDPRGLERFFVLTKEEAKGTDRTNWYAGLISLLFVIVVLAATAFEFYSRS
ncbi:hypothetical protein [uncultured Sulfitobacter sp.]|uniref:hypothetical protein n=1 Tax=uncultured Sulfitobacter sp. TaxID=191468 RepID=UPI0026323176|nr:hypothetical protein [uncultured Sulfitobacter sp.]